MSEERAMRDGSPSAAPPPIVAPQPSIAEMREALSKWWDQRAAALNTSRNPLDLPVLIGAVQGLEEDMTFLLRLVSSLLAAVEDRGAAKRDV